ncbi:hypothetical protein [Serratia marcescens]|uniref:hypothetical protein n=1 Tax=Serratia marcescens TaxID=615 RepID=UPI002020BFEE|nr:hypothetical protein [Serratia marcescens]
MHEFASLLQDLDQRAAPVLARLSLFQAAALKLTHEAGRRGGDSIARRHVFNYQN